MMQDKTEEEYSSCSACGHQLDLTCLLMDCPSSKSPARHLWHHFLWENLAGQRSVRKVSSLWDMWWFGLMIWQGPVDKGLQQGTGLHQMRVSSYSFSGRTVRSGTRWNSKATLKERNKPGTIYSYIRS